MEKIKADATMGDLTRAKMKLEAYGYKRYADRNYKKELREIDKQINYIDKNYGDLFWIGLMGIGHYNFLAKVLDVWEITDEENTTMNDILVEEIEIIRKEEDFLLSRMPEIAKEYFPTDELSEELLITKYQKINKAIENYHYLSNENNYSLSQFEDAKNIVENLMIKLSLTNTQRISLFQDYNDKDWEFINIYPIHFKNGDSIYYTLKKGKKFYNFNIIKEDEAYTYVKELKGIGKNYFYHK